MRKRWLILAGTLLSLTALLPLALWLAGGHPGIHAWGLARAQAALAPLGLELRVGDISGNLWGALTLSQVRLGSPEQGWWGAAEIRLEHHPWTLLYGTLTLSQLSMRQPDLPVLLALGGSGDMDLSIHIQRLLVQEGRAAALLPDSAGFRLGEFGLEAELNLSGAGGHLSLHNFQSTAVCGDLTWPLTLKGDLTWRGTELLTPELSLSVGDDQLFLGGRLNLEQLQSLGNRLAEGGPALPAMAAWDQGSAWKLKARWSDGNLARIWGLSWPEELLPLTVDMEAAVKGLDLNLVNMSLEGQGNRLVLSGELPLAGWLDMAQRLRSVNTGPPSAVPYEAALQAQGTFTPGLLAGLGSPPVPSPFNFTLDLDWEQKTPAPAEVRLRGTLESPQKDEPPLRLNLRADWQADQDVLRAEINLRDLDPDQFYALPLETSLSGGLHLTWPRPFTFSQQERSATLTADLLLGKLRFSPDLDLGATSLRAQLDLRGRNLSSPELRLSGVWGKLRAAGFYDWRIPPAAADAISASSEFKVDLQWQELALPPAYKQLLPEWLGHPYAQGQAFISGTPAGGQGEVRLTPILPRKEENPVPAELRVWGGWQGQDAYLSGLRLAGLGVFAQAEGRADLKSADLRLKLNLSELMDWQPWFRAWGLPAMQGEISLDAGLRGPWSGPELMAAGVLEKVDCPEPALKLESLDFKIQRQGPWRESQFKGQGRLREFTWPEHELKIKDLKFSLDFSRFSWQDPLGNLSLELREAVWGRNTGRDLRLESRFQPGSSRLEAALRGSGFDLSLQAQGQGALFLPQEIIISKIELTPQMKARQLWRQEGQARLRLGTDMFQLHDLLLKNGSRRAEFSLDMRPQDCRGFFKVENLELLEWLPPEVLGEFISPRSRFNLELNLSGPPQEPAFTAQAQVLNMERPPYQPLEALELKAGLYQGRLGLELKGRARNKELLNLEADINARLSLLPFKFDYDAEGLRGQFKANAVPLNLLTPFLAPALNRWRGEADVNLSLGGNPLYPRLRGQLRIKQGGFEISATGQRIRNLEAALEFQNRRVEFRSFSYEHQGELTLAGYLMLPAHPQDDGQISLRLLGRDLLVSLGQWGDVRVNTDLEAQGGLNDFKLSGQIKPTAAALHIGKAAPDSLDEVIIVSPKEPPPPLAMPAGMAGDFYPPEILSGTTWDVLVDLGQSTRLTVDQGWALAGGRAAIRKLPQSPLHFQGRLRLQQGLLVFFGKRIELLGGVARLQDQTALDPQIDLEAQIRDSAADINIRLSGSVEDPKLHFSSDPPMSQTDILSSIVYGRPVSGLSAGESSQLSAQALALLGWQSSREIAKVLGDTLTPDVITVYNDEQRDRGSSLEAGKYLSPNLYVRFRNRLDEGGGSSFGLEYRLNRYFYLEGEVGNTKNSGADIMFNYDFDIPPKPQRSRRGLSSFGAAAETEQRGEDDAEEFRPPPRSAAEEGAGP